MCHRVRDDSVPERQPCACGWCVSSHLVRLRACLRASCKSGQLHKTGASALCTVDDASCFHMIRLELKTSVNDMNVTVMSTVTGCDVTNVQQQYKGSTSMLAFQSVTEGSWARAVGNHNAENTGKTPSRHTQCATACTALHAAHRQVNRNTTTHGETKLTRER